ncbi:MAG: HAMP domain-containing protein [Epulopiscium sp.]|nr:HAMP domain-containing protein [Candidatus Epulonipiscium sp.]
MEAKSGIQNKILKNTAVIALMIAVVLMLVMIFFMRSLTSSILLETLQPMAKSASQSVEGNLHMMADRIFMIGDNAAFTDEAVSKEEKQDLLDTAKSGIEFVWLALYSADGSLYTGSVSSPSSISQGEFFTMLKDTRNLVIDDTRVTENGLEIVIGVPLFDKNKEIIYYLIGSYKYDVLNDVLSNINIGKNGTAFIINKDGKYMAHHDSQLVFDEKTLFDSFGDKEEIHKLSEQMLVGQTGVAEIGSWNQKRIFSYSPIRGTRWSLAVTAPQSDFMAAANKAVLVGFIITCVLLLLAAAMMHRLSSRIQGPLGRVTSRIATLAEGDLHTKVEVENTNDETEILSRALANTVESMNLYTTELTRVLTELSQSNLDISVDGTFQGDFVVMKDSLDQIIEYLNEIMYEIQQAAIEVSQTSYQVQENAFQVETSSGGQAEAVTRLYDETIIIQENVEEVNKHTDTMRQFMESANSSIGAGSVHMKEMINAMNKISSNSTEIKKINAFMEDIALQTHILALNASIEAAHAGVFGKGFAVVASEIGNLAAKSGHSSRQTAEIIENSMQAITDGVNCAKQTAVSIQEMAEISAKIFDIAHKLSSAVMKEKRALETISQQISEINALAQNNLDSSRQSAAASQTLTEQSDNLKKRIQRFRLKR